MHKNFVKILPLAAAVLLATSCSKDENKETVENNEVVNSETSLELPFSVTVKTGSSLSKIKCEDGTSGVETTFNQTDLDKHVKMVVTGTGITEGDLFLIDLNGTFDGKLKFETEEAKNAVIGSSVTLSATVKINENSTMKWSPNSLEDLIQGCEHTYDVSKTDDGNITPFYYGDKDLVLYDNNSYIEVIWKNKGNAEIDINENSYTLNDNGKGWLMITPNIVIESSTLGITDGTHTTVKGQIHTISRVVVPEGYVDLGVKVDGKSVYWAQNNLGTGTYTWANAKTAATNAGGELPTKDDFVALANACYWVWGQKDGTNGIYAYKLRKGESSNYTETSFNNDRNYSPETDPSYIFFPVCPGGYKYGVYWSSTESLYYEGHAYGASCLHIESHIVSPESDYPKTDNWSVRTVRRSN